MSDVNKSSVFNLIRDRYDSTTVTVFECMSTYFTRMFYEHLYNLAVNYKADADMTQIDSITKGYKYALKKYAKAINTVKFYKESIKGITIELQIDYSCTLTYSTAISLVTQQFLPDDWPISSDEEDKLIRKIFIRCYDDMIYEVSYKYIPSIIDERNKNTISSLQDSFLNIFLHQKEHTESELCLNRKNKHREDKVNAETFGRFKDEFKRLLDKHTELEMVVIKLQRVIQKISNERKTLKMLNKELQLELEDEKSKIKSYELQNKLQNETQNESNNYAMNQNSFESSFPRTENIIYNENANQLPAIPLPLTTPLPTYSDYVESDIEDENIKSLAASESAHQSKPLNVAMSEVSIYSDESRGENPMDSENKDDYLRSKFRSALTEGGADNIPEKDELKTDEPEKDDFAKNKLEKDELKTDEPEKEESEESKKEITPVEDDTYPGIDMYG